MLYLKKNRVTPYPQPLMSVRGNSEISNVKRYELAPLNSVHI